MVNVEWKGNMVFKGVGVAGSPLTMDAYPEEGKSTEGPTPMEALLMAVAGCTAMDVVSILQKKRQSLTSYRIEVDADRVPAGTWPRPYTGIRVRHILKGENLDPAAVAQAIKLSDEKYCSVTASLRHGPTISTDWQIE